MKLFESGFVPLGNEPNLKSVIKADGGAMYVVAFYAADTYDRIMRQKKHFSETLDTLVKRHGARNVIVYHIFTSPNPSHELHKYVDSAADNYFGQNVYDVYYVSGPDGVYGGPDKKQTDVLGIKKMLEPCMASDGGDKVKTKDIKIRMKKPVLVYVILVINLAVFAIMELYGGSGDAQVLMSFGALSRDRVMNGGEMYRLFTVMFIHIGIVHLAHNSLSLYIFGTRLESRCGSLTFALIYIVSGLAGSVSMLLFSTASLSAGASGAIYGLMGAMLAITWLTKRTVGGLNFPVMLMFIVTGIAVGLSTPGVGNAAHIGGLVAGIFMGLVVGAVKQTKLS